MLRVSVPAGLLSLVALGCSDPAPPIAEVAAQYTISGDCGTNGPPGGIGATTPLYKGYPTGLPDLPPPSGYPVEKGGPIIDGEEGPDATGPNYDVKCTIAGDGDLSLDVSMSGQNTALSGGNVKTSLSVSGTIKKDGTGTVDVAQFTKEIQTVSGSGCTITAVPKTNGDPDMGPGQLFATYVCKGVTLDVLHPNCSAKGTLVLDKCETK
jgi:hypothetical protein